MTHSGVFLTEFEVFWIADETLSQVYISSHASETKIYE